MKPFLLAGWGLLASALVAGCGSDDSNATKPAPNPGSIGCKSGTLGAGDATLSIDADGGTRDYLVHVPPSYEQGKSMPVVLAFHGLGGTGEQVASRIGMNTKSDSAGFVVVYPNGVSLSWNGGACCGDAVSNDVDDVGFARAVVADVSKQLCVDPKRVYATGLSNGAFLVHRLACEAADVFAAVAPVAGVLAIPPDSCKPSRPVPIEEFHGTADTLVLYDGGGPNNLPSVPATFEGWATRDACTDASTTVSYSKGDASCATYSTCAAGVKVTLCTITGGGHCWPGETSCPYGATTSDISANDAMWEFFSAFALP
jgi:polyhydroxybutyrate depolymerase